jgi:hypothetical protein
VLITKSDAVAPTVVTEAVKAVKVVADGINVTVVGLMADR